MVDFPSGVPATDPTDLVGANATTPAKLTINAVGRGIISATTAQEQRTVMQAAASPSLAAEYTEMLLNITAGLSQGIASFTTGGSNAAALITGRNGLVRSSSGATATADRVAGLGSSTAATMLLGIGEVDFTVEGSHQVAIATGVNTGTIHIGLHDCPNSAVEATDGVFFRSVNGGNYFAVCRSNNVETAVDTGIAPALDTFRFWRVIVNANATSATLKIYDASAAEIDSRTIATNIPSGAGRHVGHGMRLVRNAAVAVDQAFDSDTFFLRFTFLSPLPFQ